VKRRGFITLLGGATVWPRAAYAQQPAMPVIGFLAPVAASEHQLRGFHQGLKQAGFGEGENVSILYRSAENEIDRLPALAVDLARRGVAVIATVAYAAALAAKNATAMIPILFVSGEDPVKLGLVASVARSGGNLTGVNILATELVAKQLALLRELLPTAARVAVLVDPSNKSIAEPTLQEVGSAARTMALQIQILNASNGREIGAAFAAFERERPDALFVSLGPYLLLGACNSPPWRYAT
jgi:putative tryptophan/tyrosine transport system substrate-binding protein